MLELNKNYFELFGLSLSFQVDLSLLKSNYRQILLKVHPDKFAHTTEQERRIALQYTALINEAYKTLVSPLHRAIYFLSLHCVSINLENNTAMPAEFLLEQINFREAIETAEENEQKLLIIASEISDLKLTFFEKLLADIKERVQH